METAAAYETIIICVDSKNSATLAKHLKNSGKRVIILSIMTPVDAFDIPSADTILMGYSYSPYTLNALFGALAGEYTPHGVLPLKQ
jgi:beta-N-acetylhexosaminidase